MIAVIFLLGLPFLSRSVALDMAALAERRDLQKHDLAALRAEVSLMIRSSRDRDYPMRWFGREVPTEELPPIVAALSARAAYVTVSEGGATIVTDGLGSWRGGYFIQPEGVSMPPVDAREILDGVHYVIAK